MIRFLRYLLRRTVLLALIVGLACFTAFDLFPYIHDRSPLLIAVLITYVLLAYLFVPALIRIFRIFDQPNRIPTCAMTGDGWPSDPVNIAIMATDEQELIAGMQQAGWHVADQPSLRTVCHIVWAIIANKPYPTAPFSNLYLFGRKQDIGFQIPVGNSPRRRHHVRFWHVTQTSVLQPDSIATQHHGFWQALLQRFWHKEQQLWVGACIYDSGPLDIMWRNGQLNHRVHPDADRERDFILTTLKTAGTVKHIASIKSGEPYNRWGQGLAGKIVSDGYVSLCTFDHGAITRRVGK